MLDAILSLAVIAWGILVFLCPMALFLLLLKVESILNLLKEEFKNDDNSK